LNQSKLVKLKVVQTLMLLGIWRKSNMLKYNTDIQPAFGGTRSDFRNEAIKMISLLKEYDFLLTDELKVFLTDQERQLRQRDLKLSLFQIWKRVPEDINKTEIFEYPIKYSGNSPNQYLYKLDDSDIFIEESTQYRSILSTIIEKSQGTQYQHHFGSGAPKFKELLYKVFKTLYPCSGNSNDDSFLQYVNIKLRNHYQLIIYRDNEGEFVRIMIPLYGLTNEIKGYNHLVGDERIEFSGGTLHYLQHLHLMGKLLSAIDKRKATDSSKDDFIELELLTDIIDGVNECRKCRVNSMVFQNRSGTKKLISLYRKNIELAKGENYQVIFIKSIYRRDKDGKTTTKR
jgi:hypothetical protein